ENMRQNTVEVALSRCRNRLYAAVPRRDRRVATGADREDRPAASRSPGEGVRRVVERKSLGARHQQGGWPLARRDQAAPREGEARRVAIAAGWCRVSQHDLDFWRFSRELDAAWLRQRLHTTMSASRAGIDEAPLLRELEDADPLAAPPRRNVITALREVCAFWPGRLVLATAALLLLLIGSQLGRMVQGRPGSRVAAIPPRPIYVPDDGGERTLGIAASVKPASKAKFREAMRFYSSADFSDQALPLLREAVAEDPAND